MYFHEIISWFTLLSSTCITYLLPIYFQDFCNGYEFELQINRSSSELEFPFSMMSSLGNGGTHLSNQGLPGWLGNGTSKTKTQSKQMASILLCKKSTSYWDERCSGNNWLNYFASWCSLNCLALPHLRLLMMSISIPAGTKIITFLWAVNSNSMRHIKTY